MKNIGILVDLLTKEQQSDDELAKGSDEKEKGDGDSSEELNKKRR